jgi:predicted 3-demethylubiquinone-9 3-methyltransferase (glyoxalase superfamily)
MMSMNPPKITPFLWFDGNAEEAVDFYVSVFPGSRKLGGLPGPGGKPVTVTFELGSLSFIALNGGPRFAFNKAVSFVVPCEDQAEIDHYWNALASGGGKEGHCGWLDDRFGLPWQVVPMNLGDLVKHPNAMQAMMRMTKLVIADLKAAAQ